MASMKDFADLKTLRGKLQEQEQARAIEKAEHERRARAVALEANLFHSSIGEVKKMPVSDKYMPNRPPAPAPSAPTRPRTQAEDHAAVLRESLSDQFDVNHLLDDEPSLSFSRRGVGVDVVPKLRKGHWPVQDELDLHGLRRDAARDAIGEFLRRAEQRKLRCVAVIHGRGLGSVGGEPVLRPMLHSWLEQKHQVIAFCTANMIDGGEGALLVLLKAPPF